MTSIAAISPLLRVKERIVGPSGYFNIQNEWYGYVDEFKYTIGLAGLMGFGVGCCRPELLPDDMAPMPGCYDRWSPNYGNYIHTPSASIMCFLPAHYIDIQSPGNTNAPFYGSKVVISDTQIGDSVLARPFRDGGLELAGVFVDKYQICNVRPDGSGLPNTTSGNPGDTMLTGGIGASRPLQWPCSFSTNSTTVSGTTALTSKALNPNVVTPTNQTSSVFDVARTRGVAFNAMPIWTSTQIAYLSLAHAQALLDATGTPISGATTNSAWMDVAPYAPKGNNNSGADSNKITLQFARADILGSTSLSTGGFAGEVGKSYTGAASISSIPAVEHTTHNGQLSGVVDVNGNQLEIVPGLTNINGSVSGYKMWPDSLSWNLVVSNENITASGETLIANTDDNGIWWTGPSVFDAMVFLVSNSNGTFHPNTSWINQPTRKMMTECGIPRELATSTTQTGTNIFGGDGFFRAHKTSVIPGTGGVYNGAAGGLRAGVFLRIFTNETTLQPFNYSSRPFGCRAIRLLAS